MSAPLRQQVADAEAAWLAAWTTGPVEPEGMPLGSGATAPDLSLPDETGSARSLAEFWSDGPALVMFWRHFGCSCGAERARRLADEHAAYVDAGLHPVIVAQGEPERAAVYRRRHAVPCPILCDPGLVAYRAWGLGQWPVARVLYDAPPEYWAHPHDLGVSFQDDRRRQGNPPVDDPWRAVAEFVVGTTGTVRLTHAHQYCDDFPDPRVLTTAATLG